MDEIGSKPLGMVDPGAEGLRGASCIGDMPPGPPPGGPGNRPPGGPGGPDPIPGLGTGNRLFAVDESIGVLGPPLDGLGAGNLFIGSALEDGGG